MRKLYTKVEKNGEFPLSLERLKPKQAALAVDAGLAHSLNNILQEVFLAKPYRGSQEEEEKITAVFSVFKVPHGEKRILLGEKIASLSPKEAAKKRAQFWLNHFLTKISEITEMSLQKGKEEKTKEEIFEEWKKLTTKLCQQIPDEKEKTIILGNIEEIDQIFSSLLSLSEGNFPLLETYIGDIPCFNLAAHLPKKQ